LLLAYRYVIYSLHRMLSKVRQHAERKATTHSNISSAHALSVVLPSLSAPVRHAFISTQITYLIRNPFKSPAASIP
jgi:hypothetical protein